MRLTSIGVLEVRIQSHTNSSSYLDDIARIWDGPMLGFFPREEFEVLSLSPLKKKLWERREEFAEKIRFSDARMKTDDGVTVAASTPKSQSDLVSNKGAVGAIEEFLASGAYQDSANIWWKEQPDGTPSADIHVLLSGERNEFTLTANCTKADYEYVLAQFTRIGL